MQCLLHRLFEASRQLGRLLLCHYDFSWANLKVRLASRVIPATSNGKYKVSQMELGRIAKSYVASLMCAPTSNGPNVVSIGLKELSPPDERAECDGSDRQCEGIRYATLPHLSLCVSGQIC